jgi:hypothetical protein
MAESPRLTFPTVPTTADSTPGKGWLPGKRPLLHLTWALPCAGIGLDRGNQTDMTTDSKWARAHEPREIIGKKARQVD